MPSSEYLRHQAENCLRIARTCFDLASAERLRLLAGEFTAKAAEIDQRDLGSNASAGQNQPCASKPGGG